MEEQIARLLAETQSSQETNRKNAESQLKHLYTEKAFPFTLVSLGAHNEVAINIRQAALLVLKKFVEVGWSPNLDEFDGQILIDDHDKVQVRQALLDLALGDAEERKVKSVASLVVSKIATADFPEDWPDLLPSLLQLLPHATDGQLHGALKVLQDLVDDCLNEEQFFKVARGLISTLHGVAISESRKPTLRALAISVFRSSFDTLEMIMEDHKAAVKGFAEEALQGWNPFFLDTLKTPLPHAPSDDDVSRDDGSTEHYRGMVALKLQVVKVLMRIRTVFPAVLTAHSPALFSAVWTELSNLQSQYCAFYIENDKQGRLEDADGLPYTLDFLVLEELDFMQACLRAPPVRKELEQQLQSAGTAGWIMQVMELAVNYAQITVEEEGLWDIDVNIFLSEESNVTANYTPRTACGDLVVKLGEWIPKPTQDGIYSYAKTVHTSEASWKVKEATLYILNALLRDIQDVDKTIPSEVAHSFIEIVQPALQQEDDFLRARGHLVAGSLVKTAGGALESMALQFLQTSLEAMTNDQSDVVKVSCVRSLQHYLSGMSEQSIVPLQEHIVNNLSHFLSQQDLNELSESEDVMIALLETLRDTLSLDPRICLAGNGLDLLFTIASHGASNFQLAMLITETFEQVTLRLSEAGADVFAQLSARVIPSLTSAFDVASMTEENALTNLAADLLSVLTENGSSPLPQGYVDAVMPKLQRILLTATDDELLKSATMATKFVLEHDAEQVFAWHDGENKAGLEVLLVIIDRLLGPHIDDNAGSEVGGLAAALVEKAGSDRLGPYLGQLLGAVAVRLSTAEKAQIIQSLILVFARLTFISPREVVEFLSGLSIGNQTGLQVVIPKWLENSITFAGYDEIRQNVIALTKLYDLSTPLLSSITVQGDQIITQSSRIITRSRAKQQPTQFTSVPADIKIIKVLVDELLNASTNPALDTKSTIPTNESTNDSEDDEGDEEEWEDDDNDFLDLGSGMTKESLMAFGQEGRDLGNRSDDETQQFLLGWFRDVAGRPGFEDVFGRLNDGEQEKLRRLLG